MSGPAMSFCEFAVTPEIPTVAAVRMILARVCGDARFEQGVVEGDHSAFSFCLGNSQIFICNAYACAGELIGKGLFVEYDLGSDSGQQKLEADITQILIWMCLERAKPSKRGELESKLRAMESWDRHRVAMLLAKAI